MNKQNVVYLLGFSHGSEVKNPSAPEETQDTQVQSLGWEDPLGEAWQPTPVFLPEKSHGQRSLADYSQLGHKESGMTEAACTHTN